MAWLKKWWHSAAFGVVLVASGAPVVAQTPVGDGLLAIYYDGINFERPMLRRRDPAIDFDWQHGEPAPGLPAEFFSVRWTGWLVPPVSGRYILHITTDDGMRLWLNDKLVLNEWHNQPVTQYSVAVQLQAGKSYKLRVEYYQTILDTRARFTWERPNVKPEDPAWHNGWGLTTDAPAPEVVSSRYLFTRDPLPPKAASRPAASVVTASKAQPALPPRTSQPATPAPRPASPPPRPAPATSPANTAAADSLSRRRVAQLNAGEEVVVPELLFAQGQAELLPEARAALDALATALQAQPTLRFEVQGHTDNQGNAELNRQLSQQRAETVCLYLTAHGVAAERLRPMGYGGSRPVADNADPAQRPRNRRVVLLRR